MTSKNEVFGRYIFDVFPDNPDVPEAHGVTNLSASLERVRLSGGRDVMGVQRYDVRGPDGVFQERYWAPTNAAVLDPDGKLQWIIHRVEDVTGYVRLKRAVNSRFQTEAQWRKDLALMEAEACNSTEALRKELEVSLEANDAKTQLLSAASHDLRQPLQAATLFAESLKELPLPKAAAERIRHIETSLHTLDRMLSDLLDLSRLESGKVKPFIHPFWVGCLLDNLADEFRPLAEATGLNFMFNGCNCIVFSDPVLLEQILRNLIANAIKYTAQGAVALTATKIAGQLRISVCDTGIGIPAEEQENIFVDYYRVSGSNRPEGLGIGLATVAKTAKLLGHRLTVHSRVGHGSIFSVWLPSAAGDGP